jgi:hypothetical protein
MVTHLISHRAQSDAVIPLAFPVSSALSGSQLDNLTVRKGETVYISVHGVNRDPAIWGADANEFNPERWLDPVTGKSIIREEAVKAKAPGLWSSMYVGTCSTTKIRTQF